MDLTYWILLVLSWCGVLVAQKRCYKCSGHFPDRDCELYPKYTVQDMDELMCSRSYCMSHVVYKPRRYLLTTNRFGKVQGVMRPLTPHDFAVDSVNRTCQDEAMKDACVMNHSDMSLSCFSTCANDLCNDGLRRPSWDDVGKLTPNIDYEEEENIIEDIDYKTNNENEFESRDRFSNFPQDYDENDIDDNNNNIDSDDDDDDEIDDSEMLITNKINDRFDVSSHGHGVDYPHGSSTSGNRNMTSSKPVENKVPPRRHKHGNQNDVKGKESDVGKAKGNLHIKRNKEHSGGNSQSSFTIMFTLFLQIPVYILFFLK